jgi:hypothetical protein
VDPSLAQLHSTNYPDLLHLQRLNQTEKKKKITVKDFKENKKTVDDDRNILYNMFVKFK